MEEKKLTVVEIKRTYVYSKLEQITLENVTEVIVRPSGSHRLKTADGRMHIIAPGWLVIHIESPNGWVDL